MTTSINDQQLNVSDDESKPIGRRIQKFPMLEQSKSTAYSLTDPEEILFITVIYEDPGHIAIANYIMVSAVRLDSFSGLQD